MQNNNELIDDYNFTNHTVDYSFSHGFNFSLTTRVISIILANFFGFLFFLSILGLVVFGIVFFLILTLVFLYLATSTTGVQLCVRTKYIKMYKSYIGIKRGKWKNTNNYTDISILTIRKNITTKPMYATSTITSQTADTGVYILIPSHRKRQLIKICKGKTEADRLANELATKLNKKIKVFNPKISEATKRKRYRK